MIYLGKDPVGIARVIEKSPLNLREITIAPGQYTIAEFWNACQAAAGQGNYKWMVLANKNATYFLGANGSANAATTGVFLLNNAASYGGIQRALGVSDSTAKYEITSDMKYYMYIWD